MISCSPWHGFPIFSTFFISRRQISSSPSPFCVPFHQIFQMSLWKTGRYFIAFQHRPHQWAAHLFAFSSRNLPTLPLDEKLVQRLSKGKNLGKNISCTRSMDLRASKYVLPGGKVVSFWFGSAVRPSSRSFVSGCFSSDVVRSTTWWICFQRFAWLMIAAIEMPSSKEESLRLRSKIIFHITWYLFLVKFWHEFRFRKYRLTERCTIRTGECLRKYTRRSQHMLLLKDKCADTVPLKQQWVRKKCQWILSTVLIPTCQDVSKMVLGQIPAFWFG